MGTPIDDWKQKHRCPFTDGGARCSRPAGHASDHAVWRHGLRGEPLRRVFLPRKPEIGPGA